MIKFVSKIYAFESGDGAEAAYKQARAELIAKSPRAAEVIKAVEAAPHVIEVVISTTVGQESAFRGAMGDETASKLVWDPKHAFQILVDPTQITKKVLGRDVTTTQAKLSPLPANLVLIHELGHAEQFLGKMPNYAKLFASGKDGIAVIEADNLKETEWPVCEAYGVAKRSNYLHYNGSSDPVVSKWKKID